MYVKLTPLGSEHDKRSCLVLIPSAKLSDRCPQLLFNRCSIMILSEVPVFMKSVKFYEKYRTQMDF